MVSPEAIGAYETSRLVIAGTVLQLGCVVGRTNSLGSVFVQRRDVQVHRRSDLCVTST